MRKTLSLLMLAIGSGLYCVWAAADTFRDQLIIINSDGLSYTAQQTLASDGELIVVALPNERITLNVQFSGPEKNTFEQAHQLNPDKLSIWSGSVLTRYRHQHSSATQSESGIYELTMKPQDNLTSIEHIDAMHSSFSWVLPEEFELLSFFATELSSEVPIDHWSTSGNTVSFKRTGGPVASISIKYRRREEASRQGEPCLTVIVDNDECSPDIDGDEIPDYRDICIYPNEAVSVTDTSAAAPGAAAPGTSNTSVELVLDSDTTNDISATNSLFGCANASQMVLDGVRFQSGQSYLDVQARQVLDRVAIALQRAPDQLFEVASHTDNAGRIAHNQRLSENRADAVRHYLMLRGVGPNQLQARGYGETSPVHDNRFAAGRRANRRVELRQLQ